MKDWSKYKQDTVFNGSDENGVRLLPEFLKDYQNTFSAVPEAGCQKCLQRYYIRLTTKIQNMKNPTNSEFKLKKMFEGISSGFGKKKSFNNSNMTDQDALWLHDNHPHGAKLFEVIPSNIDEIRKGSSSDQDLSKLKKDELITLAESKGVEIPDGATKAILIELIESV